jgi:hypothetical protein
MKRGHHVLLAGTALALAAHTPQPALAQSRAADSVDVTEALEHYASLMRRMASDSIGAMFTPNGELVGTGRPPVVGPAAIAAFLASFSSYHVLADSMRATGIRFSGDTAVQRGTFWQQVQVPAGDTVVARGSFEVTALLTVRCPTQEIEEMISWLPEPLSSPRQAIARSGWFASSTHRAARSSMP